MRTFGNPQKISLGAPRTSLMPSSEKKVRSSECHLPNWTVNNFTLKGPFSALNEIFAA